LPSEPLYNQTAVRFPAKVNCRQEKSNQSDYCRFDFTKASLWMTPEWQRSFATDSFSKVSSRKSIPAAILSFNPECRPGIGSGCQRE
jgi:hypothetical protein